METTFNMSICNFPLILSYMKTTYNLYVLKKKLITYMKTI